MFTKFFGSSSKNGGKSSQQQPTPEVLPKGMTFQQVQQQQALVRISKQVAESKEKIDEQYERIEKEELKIKDLIAKGKRTAAKRQLAMFKILQDQLNKSENLLTVLEKSKIQLMTSLETKNMTDAISIANKLQSELNSNIDEIQDILLDRKELEQDQKEIANLISGLANGTEEEREEIDELYEQYEKEVVNERILNINTDPVNANIGAKTQKISKPSLQQVQKQLQEPEVSLKIYYCNPHNTPKSDPLNSPIYLRRSWLFS